VLVDAIKRGASDIHFEPYETDYRVRFRMDGILRQVAKAPGEAARAHRRAPEGDVAAGHRRAPRAAGRPHQAEPVSKTKQIDFRVSTCPTLFGEKVVLRILDGSAAKLGIDKLGYEDDQQKLFLDAIQQALRHGAGDRPHRLAARPSRCTPRLNILNTDERNISTAEDPVEIRLPGINQVQMNVKAA
jgi:type IV pilus assembly protein PilB